MPPVKRRIHINVDSHVAEKLEEMWRNAVDEANKKGDRIPSFSEVINRWLKEILKLP
ncbi:MAG: hypothetical protein QW372_01750 [Nitrososphaerales archaeon]